MDRPGKVIVIGAGPAGLALAHMLHLANIDFVVYEKRDEIVRKNDGTALALQPSGLRLLDQLGLLEAARSLAPPLQDYEVRGPNAELLVTYPNGERLREK